MPSSPNFYSPSLPTTSSNLSASQLYSHSISISPSPLSLMPSSPNFYSPGLPTTSSDDDDTFSWMPMSPLASPSSTPNSPLMCMTCCGLQDVSTSQNIMAHGRLGCMHEIWHGNLPICRGPVVMLRYAFIKFSPVLHGSRRLTTDTKTPFLDQCPPKSRSVGHCPDRQEVYGPIGSQLQQAGRSSLPRIRRAPKSKVYIVTDTIVL